VFLKNATLWFYWGKSQKAGTGECHFFHFFRTARKTEKLFFSPVPF